MQTTEALVLYDDLVSELESNRDAGTDLIPVFRYSDRLIEAMNERGVFDPNIAYGVLVDAQETLAAEL